MSDISKFILTNIHTLLTNEFINFVQSTPESEETKLKCISLYSQFITNSINPQPNVPQPNVPQPNVPQPNVPQPNVPQPNVPQPNVPQPNVPHPKVPQVKMLTGECEYVFTKGPRKDERCYKKFRCETLKSPMFCTRHAKHEVLLPIFIKPKKKEVPDIQEVPDILSETDHSSNNSSDSEDIIQSLEDELRMTMDLLNEEYDAN